MFFFLLLKKQRETEGEREDSRAAAAHEVSEFHTLITRLFLPCLPSSTVTRALLNSLYYSKPNLSLV